MARPARATGFIGANLRKARRDKKLSQEDVAQLLGVHRATLIRWESDLSEPPTENIEELARHLERPVDWFYEPLAEDPEDANDPARITDPWLKSFPLELLQGRTPIALRSLRRTPTEVARVAGLNRRRVEELLEGSRPTAQEIQLLRQAFGEEFNPTLSLARRLAPLPTPTPRPQLTADDKLDLLLQRVSRLDDRLQFLEQLTQLILENQGMSHE